MRKVLLLAAFAMVAATSFWQAAPAQAADDCVVTVGRVVPLTGPSPGHGP